MITSYKIQQEIISLENNTYIIYKYVGDNKRLWRQMMCLYKETHPDLPPPRGRC